MTTKVIGNKNSCHVIMTIIQGSLRFPSKFIFFWTSPRCCGVTLLKHGIKTFRLQIDPLETL